MNTNKLPVVLKVKLPQKIIGCSEYSIISRKRHNYFHFPRSLARTGRDYFHLSVNSSFSRSERSAANSATRTREE